MPPREAPRPEAGRTRPHLVDAFSASRTQPRTSVEPNGGCAEPSRTEMSATTRSAGCWRSIPSTSTSSSCGVCVRKCSADDGGRGAVASVWVSFGNHPSGGSNECYGCVEAVKVDERSPGTLSTVWLGPRRPERSAITVTAAAATTCSSSTSGRPQEPSTPPSHPPPRRRTRRASARSGCWLAQLPRRELTRDAARA